MHVDGEIPSDSSFQVNHSEELNKAKIKDTILRDCFGKMNKNAYNVYIFKIKMENGYYVEFEDSLDVTGLESYEFIVKVN
jgi:hypothetical protein